MNKSIAPQGLRPIRGRVTGAGRFSILAIDFIVISISLIKLPAFPCHKKETSQVYFEAFSVRYCNIEVLNAWSPEKPVRCVKLR